MLTIKYYGIGDSRGLVTDFGASPVSDMLPTDLRYMSQYSCVLRACVCVWVWVCSIHAQTHTHIITQILRSSSKETYSDKRDLFLIQIHGYLKVLYLDTLVVEEDLDTWRNAYTHANRQTPTHTQTHMQRVWDSGVGWTCESMLTCSQLKVLLVRLAQLPHMT